MEGFPTPIYALFASNRGWKPLQQQEKDAKLMPMGFTIALPDGRLCYKYGISPILYHPASLLFYRYVLTQGYRKY